MNLSMQQRDALLAGLALLRAGLEDGRIAINKEDPESDPIGDLFSNGGEHQGLSIDQLRELSDLIVDEYPCPELACVETSGAG